MLSLTRTDPLRIFYVNTLAMGTFARQQQGDLEQSILSFTEALLLYLPHTRDTPSSFLNIVHTFYHLAVGVFMRFKESSRPEDVKCCIRFFYYLHEQWHEVSMKFPFPVSTALIHALAVQVELELGDVDEDIEEMADLCDELLNSDISIQSLDHPIAAFARTIGLHFKSHFEWKNCSEKVTDCLRKAIVRLPSLHLLFMALARSLYNRFVVAPSDDYYKEGMVILDTILMFRGCGDAPSPFREEALGWAAVFADARFVAYGKPEHLEHAIYRFRTALDGTSIEGPDHAKVIGRLSSLEGLRLDGTANTQHALSIHSEFAKPPSFRDPDGLSPRGDGCQAKFDEDTREPHLRTSSFLCQTTY